MYASFFGLRRDPFSIAPDPRFLFMSERHREALAHLLYGVGGGGGFVLLTGEIGAGKTTVGRCFLEQLPAHCAVAYIFNPRLSVLELLQTVCSEFGVPVPPGAPSIKAQVDALNQFLLEAHAQGRQALLVIDEAQSLSADVLEQLRLLTNLETAERKLLQIILIGQPELRSMLGQPGLEQLAQRVIARYHLGPLSRAEVAQYIAHRLAVAGPGAPGAAASEPFDAAALAAIHKLTGGVPRRINLLADRALLGAYAQGRRSVDRATVLQAAREVFDLPAAGKAAFWRRPVPLALTATGLALVGAAVLLQATGWGGRGAGDPVEPAVLAALGAPGAGGGRDAAAAAPLPAGAGGPAPTPPGQLEGLQAQASAVPLPGQPGSPAAGDGLRRAGTGAGAAADTPPVQGGAAVGAGGAGLAPAAGDALAAELPVAAAADVLAGAVGSEGTAWRELALRWGVAIGEGDACTVARQAQLACWRSSQGGLPLLRQLGRPAILTLRGPQGSRALVLLVGLDSRHALLQAGAQRWRLPLADLSGLWRGDWATLWRTPAGWKEGQDPLVQPATRAWITERLGLPPGEGPAGLRAGLSALQLLQGLPRDGRANVPTMMWLNRGAGVDEPRLQVLP